MAISPVLILFAVLASCIFIGYLMTSRDQNTVKRPIRLIDLENGAPTGANMLISEAVDEMRGKEHIKLDAQVTSQILDSVKFELMYCMDSMIVLSASMRNPSALEDAISYVENVRHNL